MANRDGREALRGAEEETFDVLADVLTSEQWAELLKRPLQRAAFKGNRGLVQKLVGAGAGIGDALHEAARGGHADMATVLLENGASVTAKDTSPDDYTPLHVAALEGKPEMVQLLLLKGADKDTLDKSERTPLYLAAWAGHEAAALALMAAGADVGIRCDWWKRPVVHVAAQRGSVGIMRAAIECGADVNAVCTNQVAPLHHAAQYNRTEAIGVLMEAGANVQARACDGRTPLHSAASNNSLEAMLVLVKHGVNVNAQSDNQETPLHWAVGWTETPGVDVVDNLLRSGADETILNKYGKTAADLIDQRVEQADLLPDSIDRVIELLANAPADRAWRRRGYLVLCRSHPDIMRQIQGISDARAGMARTTRSRAEPERAEEASGCSGAAYEASPVDERRGGDWAVLVARVLELQEEGIFRMIMGYL